MSLIERTHDGVVFYQSELLDADGGIAHGFSTRYGGVSKGIFSSLNLGHARGDDRAAVEENYRRFCAAAGTDADRMVFTCQVHRDRIWTVTSADAGKGLWRARDWEADGADGLITDVPGIPLVVFSADCLPVLLYDPVRRVIGACHCGWRGTALGLAKKTADALCRQYGSRPSDLLAAIGPGISRCCFETDDDVPAAMRNALGDAADPAIDALGGGRYKVDCKAINRTWLLQAGLTEAHIEISDQCTCCQPEKFWSHRKVGQARGSLAAIIQLR